MAAEPSSILKVKHPIAGMHETSVLDRRIYAYSSRRTLNLDFDIVGRNTALVPVGLSLNVQRNSNAIITRRAVKHFDM